MVKPRPYYTLVSDFTLFSNNGVKRWSIEFGDYDRHVVEQELEDMQNSCDLGGTKFRIIRTSTDDQASIDAAVAVLSSPGGGDKAAAADALTVAIAALDGTTDPDLLRASARAREALFWTTQPTVGAAVDVSEQDAA